MTASHGRAARCCAVGLAALFALLPWNSAWGRGPGGSALACDGEALFENTAPGVPALDNIPVVVHALQHRDFPDDDILDAQKAFSLETIKGYFEPGGEFNKIWSANHTGLRFTLVRVERCRYRIPHTLAPNPEDQHDIPQPGGSGLDWIKRAMDRLNARTYTVDGTPKPFAGLDVYLAWSLRNASGYGARFKRPGDRKRGAILVDRECLGSGNHCDRQFAHEVGHFLSLCHVCVTQAELQGGEKRKPRTWCECLDAHTPREDCTSDQQKCVMHPLAEGTEFKSCEKVAVVKNARLAFKLPSQ
jgi:hypothetical protein